nr:hypothetical protein [Tanacetum cinerariifolium]
MYSHIVTFIYCCGADTEAVTASFKTKKACNALKHLVEEENYKVLIVAFFEPEETMVLEKPKLEFKTRERCNLL